MAKSSKTRKISRRTAVVMMGAGTLLASRGRASGRTRQPGKPRPDRCVDPAIVVPYEFQLGGQTHHAMLAATCCSESQNAILVGVEEAGRKPRPSGKSHLKPLTDRLNMDKLDEYCFMVWGLTEAQMNQMREVMPKTLGLVTRSK